MFDLSKNSILLELENTRECIIRYWAEAERKTCELIQEKYWGSNEEFITDLFHGELRGVLQNSKREEIEEAFWKDVEIAIRKLFLSAKGFRQSSRFELSQLKSFDQERLKKFSEGFGVVATRHSRYLEGRKTGGDFGLVFIRPQVKVEKSNSAIKIIVDSQESFQSGMLCQAKMKKDEIKAKYEKWGRLSKKQIEFFLDRADYFSLLLYEYSDSNVQDFHGNLEVFYWQLCKDRQLKDVQGWLRNNNFPEKFRSEVILQKLFDGNIGTSDPQIISEYINPVSKKSLVIEIGWFLDKKNPDGEPPPPEIEIQLSSLIKDNSALRRKQNVVREKLRH